MAFLRKVIQIKAIHSPNVRLALAEIAAGKEPSHRELVPGVLSYADYLTRRKTWDVVRATVGLDAEWYRGAQVLMYPPDWLNSCERECLRARCMAAPADAIGIDPAEGGDSTSMAAVNRWGIKDLVSQKTPDTNLVYIHALAFMRKHGVPPERVCIDAGGGGFEHADRMRALRDHEWPRGCPIRTVRFGESLSLDPKRGMRKIEDRMEMKEEKYAFVNRRAQLAYDLRLVIDPGMNLDGFWIAPGLTGNAGDPHCELRHQMAPIPLLYDAEGRIRMLPKNKKSDDDDKKLEKTLVQLIGHSPDEYDAVCLALHAMLYVKKRAFAGAL